MEEHKAKSGMELSELHTVRDYKFDLEESHYTRVADETNPDRSANYDDLIYSKFNNTDIPEEEKEPAHTASSAGDSSPRFGTDIDLVNKVIVRTQTPYEDFYSPNYSFVKCKNVV